MSKAGVLCSTTLLPKRTRTNVRQSKNGCLTCRARKVKCDETKPTCLRCQRSSKICEGYRDTVTTIDKTQQGSALLAVHKQADLRYASVVSIGHQFARDGWLSNQETVHSRMGLQVLLEQYQYDVEWNQQPLWACLLGQLLHSNAGVKSALVALGATYESRFLPVSDLQRKNAVSLNQKALLDLHKEIACQSQGLVPIFLACIVLGSVEVLQRRLGNTLTHLQGAFEMLAHATAGSFGSSTSNFEHLYKFAESLDLQRAWYALSDPPHLLPLSGIFEIPPAHNATDDEGNFQRFIHSCYQFTSRASKLKYCHPELRPLNLSQEQSRYIAALSCWLSRSRLAEATSKTCPSTMSYILRAQGLSTLIYVSTILEPREAAYDVYLPHFREIVEVSARVVHSRRPTSSPHTPHFQLQPGIFQALYLTAMKCRDWQLRRRAVELFSCVGIEGPWDASIMTRVAERAIEIEEVGQTLVNTKPRQDIRIAEKQRLHGCGIDSAAHPDDLSAVQIKGYFSLCQDVATMIESRNWEDPKHWVLWTETLHDWDDLSATFTIPSKTSTI